MPTIMDTESTGATCEILIRRVDHDGLRAAGPYDREGMTVFGVEALILFN